MSCSVAAGPSAKRRSRPCAAPKARTSASSASSLAAPSGPKIWIAPSNAARAAARAVACCTTVRALATRLLCHWLDQAPGLSVASAALRPVTDWALSASRCTTSRKRDSVSASCRVPAGQSKCGVSALASRTLRPIASNRLSPFGARRCRLATSALSSSRSRRSAEASLVHSSLASASLASHARSSCFSTSDLVALWECTSRQKSPSPCAVRRRCTTLSAAIFSDTNSTRRPSARLCAIMLAMVCDLPVPGGPSSTKSMPLAEATTAASCEESAGKGVNSCAGSSWASSAVGGV